MSEIDDAEVDFASDAGPGRVRVGAVPGVTVAVVS